MIVLELDVDVSNVLMKIVLERAYATPSWHLEAGTHTKKTRDLRNVIHARTKYAPEITNAFTLLK